MLTIKVVNSNGRELVKEIRSAMYRPPQETEYNFWVLTYWPVANEPPEDVLEGSVYVMNDNGKTIANYCLSKPMAN